MAYVRTRKACAKCGQKTNSKEPTPICFQCKAKGRYNDYAREYSKKFYVRRKEQGLCTQCGKPNKHRPDKTICQRCTVRHAEWSRLRRQEKRFENER